MPPSGHPPELPELFLDRSLGRRQVPDLLRAAGLRLQTLSEVYGVPAHEDVADVEWLELAGRHGWVVLMKDARIKYRAVEREALVAYRVRAFCLTGGNLRAVQMADQFLARIECITDACSEPGPFLYAVSGRALRRVSIACAAIQGDEWLGADGCKPMNTRTRTALSPRHRRRGPARCGCATRPARRLTANHTGPILSAPATGPGAPGADASQTSTRR